VLNVISSELDITHPKIRNIPFDSDNAFLDADVLIINPYNISRFWLHAISLTSGKRILGENQSNQVNRILKRRQAEIIELLKSGKIVISFLTPLSGVFIDVNREESIITNYHWLPQQQIINYLKNGAGKEISLKKNDHPFAVYYHAFKADLEYQLYLNSNDRELAFLVNKTGNPVGWELPYGKGMIFFIPPPPKGCIPEKLFGILIQCAKKHFGVNIQTPEPEWSKSLILPGETQLDEQINKIQQSMNELTKNKEEIELKKQELQQYRALLYENGKPLEIAVIKAFRLIGFNADNYKRDDKEHDIVFSSAEGRGVAEIEGKERDAIHIGKFDQLLREIHEDFEDHDQLAEGVLVGNAYRLVPLSQRTEPTFTDKVKTAVERNQFKLLSTTELFKVVVKILENPNDESYKTQCRKKIIETRGEEIRF
jgi:hypothetical protein